MMHRLPRVERRSAPWRRQENTVSARLITIGNTAVDLRPSPINPDWIRGGNPVARNAVLSSNRDRAACTLVWDCTPGEFDWHYDSDETIHILEGSVVLDDGVA